MKIIYIKRRPSRSDIIFTSNRTRQRARRDAASNWAKFSRGFRRFGFFPFFFFSFSSRNVANVFLARDDESATGRFLFLSPSSGEMTTNGGANEKNSSGKVFLKADKRRVNMKSCIRYGEEGHGGQKTGGRSTAQTD